MNEDDNSKQKKKQNNMMKYDWNFIKHEKKIVKQNELAFDRKSIMSSYGARNVHVCFLSLIILTKESFKIKSEDVWFAGKWGTLSIIPLSLGGISKLGEEVVFCRFEVWNIASKFQE